MVVVVEIWRWGSDGGEVLEEGPGPGGLSGDCARRARWESKLLLNQGFSRPVSGLLMTRI